MTTSQNDRDVFWISVVVLTIFSGLGSLFIIISILLKWRKDFSSRLVCYLSIADFCLSIICMLLCGYNLGYGHLQDQHTFICQFQPVITWYFMEVSILWLTAIAINSLKVILNGESFSFTQEIFSNIICWGLPVLTSNLPLDSEIGENYGPRNDLWCSFSQNQKGPQLANILAYYVPCLIIILYCYIRIIFVIKRYLLNSKAKNSSMDKQIGIIKRLFFFVLAYFIVWTPLTISYVYEYITGSYISFGAEFVVDNLLHVQGILNFILYGLNHQLLHNTKKKLLCCWSYCRQEGFEFKGERHENISQTNIISSYYKDSMTMSEVSVESLPLDHSV